LPLPHLLADFLFGRPAVNGEYITRISVCIHKSVPEKIGLPGKSWGKDRNAACVAKERRFKVKRDEDVSVTDAYVALRKRFTDHQ